MHRGIPVRTVGLGRKLFSGRSLVLRRHAGHSAASSKKLPETESSAKPKKKKYTETILLPRTQFPGYVKAKDRASLDEYVSKKCSFSELYRWQRENLPGPEFVLHDGPPYANGDVHVGHAINKILKDITLRNKIIAGKRVHYVPGWDCHGLPIELKVLSSKSDYGPLEIRRKARDYALRAIAKQREAFESWGVTADWSKSGCYFTNEPEYVKNQLRQFLRLYEEGLVFRDFKPVYWSPSSKTALAESELEYNGSHESTCAIVRLRVVDLPGKPRSFGSENVYALTWTSMPWTFVSNQALAFCADATYSLAKDTDGNVNIVAEPLLESVASKIGPLLSVGTITGKELEGARYLHPISRESLPFLPGRHVTTAKGTGLVHTAPAHGPEDFLVALENGLNVLSVVDVDGRYTDQAGSEFSGLYVLTEGTDTVLKRIAGDVLHVETLTHSYPYDWRTKKPILIRASDQWFIDINSIKEQAIDSVENVRIYPRVNRTSFVNGLLGQIKQRPYWCISRQRVWGTPIPALRDKRTRRMATSRKLIERLCASIDRYGPDCWWEAPPKELLGSDVIEELDIRGDDVERGEDIMDIWFDSGISWSAILPEGKADLYLEGQDQFTGWFQSSLLTSVALRGCSPYRSLFVHGFAVDENAAKMSKSLGNVVNPEEILKGVSGSKESLPYGIDVLRWWVASHGCQHSQVPVTRELLDACSQSVCKLRQTVRFLLGALYPYGSDLKVEPRYRTLDKYMLHLLYEYNAQMKEHYEKYEYHHACKTILNFVTNSVSGLYCHAIKDRLYCDEATSPSRLAAVRVTRETLTVLARTIAPILPHLAEEAWMHHPENLGTLSPMTRFFFARYGVSRTTTGVKSRRYALSESGTPLHRTLYEIPKSSHDPIAVERITTALRLKEELNKRANGNTWLLSVTVRASKHDFARLSVLHDEWSPAASELCEILQVSSLRLTEDETISETKIEIAQLEGSLCERCRRNPGTSGNGLCQRCGDVLAGISLTASQ